MDKEKVENKIKYLPPHLQKQVNDYIDFLSRRYGAKIKDYKFNFDWEGGLSDLGKKFTSVDLQHKASEWR